MSTSILVPLDGSVLAERALPTAVSIARQRHDRLELVVVHEPTSFDGFQDAPWSSMTESMQQRYVADKAVQLSGACGSPVGHALLRGDIPRETRQHARAVDADMIVMSTHGRTGLSRALAGSIADEVVRESTVPVLVLGQTVPGAAARSTLDFRKYLIPIDDSMQSRQIFDAAAALATPGSTRFLLLRIIQPVHHMMDGTLPYGYVSGPLDDDAHQLLVAEADRELTGAAADLGQRARCDVDPHVIVSDHTGTAIVDFARKFDADLIAMTTHGRGVSRMLLGSVTDAVIRSSSLPMLVFRPRRE